MGYPYLAHPPPPDPARLAELRARGEQIAADYAAQRAAERPMRLRMLELGPALRDLEKAADCGCSCHPRPADTALHEGGVRCPCQLTPDEQRANWDRMQHDPQLQELRQQFALQADADFAAAQQAATELGAGCTSFGGLAPLVITGVVDSRAFYLRLRHGEWDLEVAGPERPLDDPYTHDDPAAMVIAGGTEEQLCGPGRRVNPATAIGLIVTRVRAYVAVQDCTHPGAINFCPVCGTPTATGQGGEQPC